jgi:hypothetical protein
MTSKVLVLDPPITNLASTLESLLHRRSQPQGFQQAPRPEVAGWPQQGIAIDIEHGLDLAS